MTPVDNAPAEARRRMVVALEEERDACQRSGQADRVTQIDAELRRARGQVTGRRTPAQQTTAETVTHGDHR